VGLLAEFHRPATALQQQLRVARAKTAEELHAKRTTRFTALSAGRAQDEAGAARVLEALPEIASRFDPRVVVSGGQRVPTPDTSRLAAIPARYAVERRVLAAGGGACDPRETPFPLHRRYTNLVLHVA